MLSLSLLLPGALGKAMCWRATGLSALCFGLNLNLASDLYLLPIPMAIVYWMCARRSRAAAVRMLVWLGAIAGTLVPWMIYTWHATGKPLVKSTNQGHVLLIGLGQDPRERFGITYSDGDPKMYQILRERLGDAFARRFYASCSYEADEVLRPAFLRIVRSQPRDYLDLVGFKLKEVLLGETGTYSGEFDEGEHLGRFGIGAPVRKLLRRYTQRTGRLLQLGTTVLAPFVIWAAVRRRQAAWALVLLPIAYQYVSCSIAVLQPQYVSNLILLQLVVCAQGVGVVQHALASRARRVEGA
jgi:hypothetical protein